jgi:hypothetical protein
MTKRAAVKMNKSATMRNGEWAKIIKVDLARGDRNPDPEVGRHDKRVQNLIVIS